VLLATLRPPRTPGRSLRLQGGTESWLPFSKINGNKSSISAAKKAFDYYHAYYENRNPSPLLTIWAGNKTAIDAFEQASEPERFVLLFSVAVLPHSFFETCFGMLVFSAVALIFFLGLLYFCLLFCAMDTTQIELRAALLPF
jgi:hypothetical protein